MQNVHEHSLPIVHGFAQPRQNIAALHISGGMRVADFGAGSGAYTLAIAERLEGSGKVYAIDVQRDLLRRISNEAARRGLSNVEVIWTDLEMPRASKLANESIDLVLVSNVLFQVPDKLQVLKEARRIVKGAGNVAVIDWSGSFGGMGPVKEDVVKKDQAVLLAKKAGLELDREFTAGTHHYGLILRPVPLTDV